MFRAIPLFIIPFALYNLLLVGDDINGTLQSTLFSMGLMSGAQWVFSMSDLFIIGGVLVLYIEIFKSTGTGIKSVIDHTLSVLVFIAFLIEFLVVASAGTSTFFVLTLMALLDVVAGFTVSIVAARRDFAVGGLDH